MMNFLNGILIVEKQMSTCLSPRNSFFYLFLKNPKFLPLILAQSQLTDCTDHEPSDLQNSSILTIAILTLADIPKSTLFSPIVLSIDSIRRFVHQHVTHFWLLSSFIFLLSAACKRLPAASVCVFDELEVHIVKDWINMKMEHLLHHESVSGECHGLADHVKK
jgi:hypothetical protein